jgi:O-antigen/teichoic acid export membrane protein
MGAAASLVFYASAPLLVRLMTDSVGWATELRMGSVLVLLNSINGVQSGVLAGFENFRDIARVNVLRGVCCMAITVPAVSSWNLRGALLALVISSAVATVLSHCAIKQECRSRQVPVAYAPHPSATRPLWGFSVPAFLSSAMTIPVIWISNAMLIRSSGGYAEMGIYNAANQVRIGAGYIPGLLGQAALPILSSLHGSRDRGNYRRLLFMNLVSVVVIVGVIAVPACFASPWIMGAFGAGFRAAWPLLVVLMLSAVLSCPCGVIGQALASSGRMWPGFYLNCVWAVVLLAVAKWTVGRFGSLGLGSAMLVGYAVHSLASLWYARSRAALEYAQ